MLPHADRYACTEEWLTIVRRLWTEDEPFDFEGRYYKITQGRARAEADPAAASGDHERGLVGARPAVRGEALRCRLHHRARRRDRPTTTARMSTAYRALAREHGREIRVWTLANIIQGETEKDARDFYDYYVHQKGDWEAARNVVETFMLDVNARNIPPERMRPMQEMFIAGWGGFPLIGTKEQIVDGPDRACRAPASTACCCAGRATRKACGSSAT